MVEDRAIVPAGLIAKGASNPTLANSGWVNDGIATRIEALVPKSDRVVCVWRNRGEIVEEVLERHYREFPADRLAAQTYIFRWQSY